MRFADGSRGKPYSKDPAVVTFRGKYWMYYSRPPYQDGRTPDGWSIGIATSSDLESWDIIGGLSPACDYEANGLCAPGAIVLDDQVHLFYQTYGNGAKDAICHAYSADGIHFERNETNPIFGPTGAWNNGRAIDADVVVHEDKAYLYFATRDPEGEVQQLGVATAPYPSNFARELWTQVAGESSILKPELPWEGKCIEAPAVCRHDGRWFMFYGGDYNNGPQQVGCAVSDDGLTWTRLFQEPFLPSGGDGEWNSSESGHPFVFVDTDGRTYLFYQGNNDHGHTWYLSKHEIVWAGGVPVLR